MAGSKRKFPIVVISMVAILAIVIGLLFFNSGGCREKCKTSENADDAQTTVSHIESVVNGIAITTTNEQNPTTSVTTVGENSATANIIGETLQNTAAVTTKTTNNTTTITTNSTAKTTAVTTQKPTKTTKKTTLKKTTTTTKTQYKTIILHQKTTYYGFEGYFTLDYNEDCYDYLSKLNIYDGERSKACWYPSEYRDVDNDCCVWFVCYNVPAQKIMYHIDGGNGRAGLGVKTKEG